jgi:hypothetical protein
MPIVFSDTYVIKIENGTKTADFSENEIFTTAARIARDVMMTWSSEMIVRLVSESDVTSCGSPAPSCRYFTSVFQNYVI